MTGTPVTLAEQGIFFEPEEAGDLVDVLMEAAIVLHCLAGVPDAEAAAAQAVTGGRGSCQDLAIDLQLAAADIAERAGEPAPWAGKKEQATTRPAAAAKHPGHAGKKQHSETGH
jgi:hypothetical protein